MEFIDNKQ